MKPHHLWLILLAGAAHAQPAETYHVFEVEVPTVRGFSVTLHSRLRTQPQSSGLYQVRFGPVINWQVRARATLIGGYYFAEQKDADGYGPVHRPFVGASSTLFSTTAVQLVSRVIAERFLAADVADFNRYRSSLRLSGKGRIAPYTGFEVLLDRHGWRSNRIAGGIRASVGRHLRVDGGYFFESRRTDAGGDRHVWTTGLSYEWDRHGHDSP